MPSLLEIEKMIQQVIPFAELAVEPVPVKKDYAFAITDAVITVETRLTAEYDSMMLVYVYDRNKQGYIVLHDQYGILIQPGKGQTTRDKIKALGIYLHKRFQLGVWEGKECVAHII